MKRLYFILLIPILIAGLFFVDSMDIFSGKATADAVAIREGNIVTVNGLGTVKMKPDIAYINIGVQIFDADAKKAQDENGKIMDKVISAIKNNGIKDEDIKTIQYSIHKSFRAEPKPFGGNEDRVEGYYSRNVVQITIRDIDNVGKIIDVAGDAGANTINNIRFGIDDEDKYYSQALKLAMENASVKADAILSTFGAKANKPYRVEERSYGAPPILYRDNAMYKAEMAESSYGTSVEAGELEITANVFVEYKY